MTDALSRVSSSKTATGEWMTLLGHKTDIMFRRYIQTNDERFIEVANALAKHRASEMANSFRTQNGHQIRSRTILDCFATRKKCRKINNLEEEGARWPHRSSKPAWRALRSPEGSTPSLLRH